MDSDIYQILGDFDRRLQDLERWSGSGSGGGNYSDIKAEVPSGTMNSSNVTFTIANTPIDGEIQLFINRTLLAPTDDYTLAGKTITMVDAPDSGDSLLAYYQTQTGTMVGSNSLVMAEEMGGTADGSNVTFTIENERIPGTLVVKRDGQELYETNDFTVSGTTITMNSAPASGSEMRATYQVEVVATANADTLDGLHANTIMQQMWLFNQVFN